MDSAIPRGRLEEIVRDAHARTGVPAAAAGLLVDGEIELCSVGGVEPDTPFRVASLTKWITASLAVQCLDLDAPLAGASARALLSHTAGWRPESEQPLPAVAQGLWSYSNAGYRAVGSACADASGMRYADAAQERLLEPLGMAESGFSRPAGAPFGHAQAGATGHRRIDDDGYPEDRYPGGGLWSTVGDMLRFAAHQLGGPGPLSEAQRAELLVPHAQALGGEYALGVWRRRLADGREVWEHSGSVAGFQSLLLLLPDEPAALVVLTNSWRGNGLILRAVRALGLAPATTMEPGTPAAAGVYRLDHDEAVVEAGAEVLHVAESGADPVTGDAIVLPGYPVTSLGGGVYGFAGGYLLAHRLDFPRPGIARVGWIALPRA
jgi:CubicO group peptidase (beta-lactamase class C family)